jgi:hypothetical protein
LRGQDLNLRPSGYESGPDVAEASDSANIVATGFGVTRSETPLVAARGQNSGDETPRLLDSQIAEMLLQQALQIMSNKLLLGMRAPAAPN